MESSFQQKNINIYIKYVISGGIAAIVDLSILHFLDSYEYHYLISVNIAFLIAFFVSFNLQRKWTFSDAEVGKTHHRLIIYFIISVWNVFLNSLIIHYLLLINILPTNLIVGSLVIAQIISGLIVAVESFIIYRYFIFKKAPTLTFEKEELI